MKFIVCKDELIIIKLRNKKLRKYYDPKKTGKAKTNVFKSNPELIWKRIAKAYSINYELFEHERKDRIVNNENARHMFRIDFPDLNISEFAYSSSRLLAQRKVAQQIYNTYKNKQYNVEDLI